MCPSTSAKVRREYTSAIRWRVYPQQTLGFAISPRPTRDKFHGGSAAHWKGRWNSCIWLRVACERAVKVNACTVLIAVGDAFLTELGPEER